MRLPDGALVQGHGRVDRPPRRRTERLRRPLALGDGRGPGLRHDLAARAGRQHERRRHDLRARPARRPHRSRLDAARRRDDDRPGRSASSASPKTASRAVVGQGRRHRRRTATRSGTPTCTSPAPPHSVDLAPGHDLGRLLRRDERRRLAGLLHHRRQTAPGRHRRRSADIYEATVVGSRPTGVPAAGQRRRRPPATAPPAPRPKTGTCPRAAGNCGVVAIGGGGGVRPTAGPSTSSARSCSTAPAPGSPTSPTSTSARGGGPAQFVATLDSTPKARSPTRPCSTRSPHPERRIATPTSRSAPDGGYAAFPSTQSLTGYASEGESEVFRYATAARPALACVSCTPTNAKSEGGTTLPVGGLGLTADGRVFFSTDDALSLARPQQTADAYEWENGTTQLISTGASPSPSALLGVSADGTDAFFFTRDQLAPQDANGNHVKIYDARADGGFAFTPPPVPCKASDECHGPSRSRLPRRRSTRSEARAATTSPKPQSARRARPGRRATASPSTKKKQAPQEEDVKPKKEAAGKHGLSGGASAAVARRPWRSSPCCLLSGRQRRRDRADRKLRNARSRPTKPAATRTSTSTSRSANPGSPEAARNVNFNAPDRALRQPQRGAPLHGSGDFALTECPSDDPGRPDHDLRADYEGDPHDLLGTAPSTTSNRAPNRPRSSASSCRSSTSRSRSRSRSARAATTACASRSPKSPRKRRSRRPNLDDLGLPGANRSTTANASRQASPGEPAGLRRRSGHRLHRQRRPPTDDRPVSR